MREITCIAKKFRWLLLRMLVLLLQLRRQLVLPNRKRKGNLLHTLFLLYIGLIATIQQVEYRRFRMVHVFSNRWVRKGWLLVSFFLLFLTSFELPAVAQPANPFNTPSECTTSSTLKEAAERLARIHPVSPLRLAGEIKFSTLPAMATGFDREPARLYIQYRSLLI